MRTRYHRKEPGHYGSTVYVMGRIVMGKQIEIRIAVNQHELDVGRQVVAFRLRRARRELAKVAELAWQDYSNEHIRNHYADA